MPKKVILGNLIDKLYQSRTNRIELQREVDELKVKERAVKEQIMGELRKQGLQGSKGHFATAAITSSVEPVAEDWKKIYSYVKKHDAFYLLHQRIASTAWRELHTGGGMVPGIGAIEVEDLSLTKVSKG